MAVDLTDARTAAVAVLTTVERGKTTLTEELERVRPQISDRRDRGLLFELTAGALRWQRALDARLAAVSERPVEALDAPIRAVLRLAVYQLRYLTRIPPHAVVHEAVETARRVGRSRASGFVNGVLRSLLRAGDDGLLPARPEATAPPTAWLPYLGVTLSHPDWLLRRWLEGHAPQAVEQWCTFNNTAPHVTLRVRRDADVGVVMSRLAAEDIAAVPAPYAAAAIHLPAGAAGRVPPEVMKDAWIQDEGSQLVAAVAVARRSTRLLDLCASPGGKALIVHVDSHPAPAIVACDLRAPRVALLARTVSGRDIAIVRLDGRKPLPFLPAFDTVLIDAPCSGLGTLRRDPDLKWSRTPADVARLSDQALSILEQGAQVARPGGAVVYATCSSEPDENEGVVGRFLAAHPEFRDTRVELPESVHDAAALIDAAGHLRTWPYRHGLDAFFASVLVRT